MAVYGSGTRRPGGSLVRPPEPRHPLDPDTALRCPLAAADQCIPSFIVADQSVHWSLYYQNNLLINIMGGATCTAIMLRGRALRCAVQSTESYVRGMGYMYRGNLLVHLPMAH